MQDLDDGALVECCSTSVEPSTPSLFEPERMLSLMTLAANMGWVSSLAGLMASRGHLVRTLGDEPHRSALDDLVTYLDRALKVESTFGRGSLLRLDHPAVGRAIASGQITQDHIECAKRYPNSMKEVFQR